MTLSEIIAAFHWMELHAMSHSQDRVALLRELHQQGKPLREISEQLGWTVSWVSRIALENGLRRKITISQEQREQIRDLADAYPVREIAKRVGCSRSQAANWVLFWRERDAEKRGDIATRRCNTPRRCPVHGLLKIWPCVACAAEAAKTNPDTVRRKAKLP